MNLLPFAILLFVLPFGTALQSIAIGTVTFWIVIQKRSRLKDLASRIGMDERRSIGLLLMVALLQMGATLLNPKNPEHDIISFFLGFAPMIFLPCLFVLTQPLERPSLQKLERFWSVIMALWALVALTQNIWGWKIAGTSIVTGEHFQRAQGFYSHPLTLAYVALMLWPFHFVLFCRDMKKLSRTVMLIANLALLYFSASRTAQAVALLVSLGYIFHYFKGRNRWFVVGALLLAGFAIFSTDNLVSKRFKSMGTQISEEKESPYPDDRIAFWVVHYIMVKERPLMGHGINLDRKYRLPYYEAVGLPHFKKAYEAHNQILQIAAEGGIVAAIAFMFWMLSLHLNWYYGPKLLRNIRDMTILALFLGGLTQNAYFDGEVRYALMTLMALAFAMGFSGVERPPQVTGSLPA